ncbi:MULTISPECIES: 4Fe-4S cluster-binding domain-containing protein [Megasphaera]|uniref:4Fe-4S single cluster domain protein n=1 Tax=Megasphaera vaginalis (ex Srinivasan et al. 2021) TaxID=1111454 RepID=U7UJR0_9FIRM|nr:MULTISPECIES: 4Fe-4S cluster-binding domain-containing protein [Megasphaera]ERT59561.1 4Fe-4S single cluster domain protein [Megasphaera vaginalis (ex Srinivasan et al. 2021)]
MKVRHFCQPAPNQMVYKTREGGATVTVFVPYDCYNNCPFCINKEEYADPVGFSAEKICRSIKTMDRITPNCDFVFTGGEPFADLQILQQMLDVVPLTHKVYINTTLPISSVQSEEDIIRFTERNKHKITCINVSRHMQHYVVESNDTLLSKLAVPFRINCVLYKKYPFREMVPYLERFLRVAGASIQFRFDYTETTLDNLYDEEHDGILADLRKLSSYVGLDGCRMRCGFHFDYKGLELTYHKTLPYSTIVEKDGKDGVTYDILYDILIKQNGDIHSDWDGTPLDIKAYENVVFEPYDLQWLQERRQNKVSPLPAAAVI